ncbi:MAG: sensor histidine kinase [Desulfobaccales bacterium]
MKLRLILLILSLLSFLSASAGGYLYYASLKEGAVHEAERQSLNRLAAIKKNLSTSLSENVKPARVLAGIKEIREALVRPEAGSLAQANAMLDYFQKTLDAEVCYLMDRRGNTVASSNRHAPDSFVGNNFAFRPYFQQAIAGAPSAYLALGTTSKKRGAYYGHPVYGKKEAPLGVVVIKASIEHIEEELGADRDEIVLVTDPSGIIFISSRQGWLNETIQQLSPEQTAKIAQSVQFGAGPWPWTGLTLKDPSIAADAAGEEYLLHRLEMERYPGWHVIHLRSLKAIAKTVSDPFRRIAGPSILILLLLIGLAVGVLYRKASRELTRRREAEVALRKSEERYRALYNNTPAMLHSVDPAGSLLSVSDYWCEMSGYSREEVIGRNILEFHNEASRRYAEETVFPEFRKNGFVKDVPYQFVKKNGEVIDILLCAFGERDDQGNLFRSLSVSIDVTERLQAERALKLAQEELSSYSQDLERQIRNRTREIASILNYTPAVIYIKDRDGRYTLINPRFEKLFGLSQEEVRGKTDYDIFPPETADQIKANDSQVLATQACQQVEEQMPQADGMHTYLSVKFPIYDDARTVSGLCSISTDITEVKKAQDQLRRLSGSIIAGQEKERTAIARELHDELGQMLTALRLDCVWLSARVKGTDGSARERAEGMCGLIDKGIQEVREMAVRLRPGVLDRLGLVDALEWYTTDFERRTGITCFFEREGVPAIPDNVATAAYRIAQEALTNVARHTNANLVNVMLQAQDGLLTLTVADNGQGFDATKLTAEEGLGIAGMKERASLAGGKLEVQSQARKGTSIYFKVPIELTSSLSSPVPGQPLKMNRIS